MIDIGSKVIIRCGDAVLADKVGIVVGRGFNSPTLIVEFETKLPSPYWTNKIHFRKEELCLYSDETVP